MADALPLTTLIVIADQAKRSLFDQSMKSAGFKIRDAVNGAEGLQFASEIPDVIILDLHLPDMSGFEVCCRLKAHASTALIPVLHLSDEPIEDSQYEEHDQIGEEAYLTHPVNSVELIASIKSLLRGRHAQRQFKSFLEAAPDAVVIVDQAGLIVRVNEQAEKMFRWDRKEMLGQDVIILLPERFREKYQKQRPGFLANPNTYPMGKFAELYGLRQDRTEFPAEISISPIPEHGSFLIASIIRDVSERKQVELRLQQSETLQRLILDSIPQKLVTTKPDGSVDYFNPQWMEYTGLSFDQLRDWGWKQCVHPDDIEQHIHEWLHAIETGQVYEHQSRFRRADGEYRWHISCGVPIRNATGQIAMWVGANTDIHNIKLIELKLVNSEIRFRRLFETAKDGILILDNDSGKITDANPFMSELLGYPLEHFVGKQLWEIGFFRDKAANEAAVQTLREKGFIRYEHLPLETSQGLKVEVEIVANTYRENEQNVFQCNIRDITDRNRLEQIALQQTEVLAELHRRKDEFLSMLSHELRNPLAPIINAVQLLSLQTNVAKVQQQALAIIERQVAQLTRLVDDLLEVSRISTGRIHLKKERIGLHGIAERAVETVRPLLNQHSHEFTVRLSTQPIWLDADPARLEQLIVNLLTNAAKYTPDHGRISLTIQQENHMAVLRVRDSGVGITPELLRDIFDLFTQAERSLDRSQGGLGIGLSLVKRLVEMHGGQVEASSVLGQGSEFVVRLPMMITPKAEPDTCLEDTTKRAGPSLRVLVVDDNRDAAQSLGLLLEASGHDVRIAFDSPTALKIAFAFLPNAIILDIGLPQIDGYEVAKRIRKHPELTGVLLVAMTGYGKDTDKQLSHDAGFNHHLVKPADFGQVQQIFASISEKVIP